MLTNLALWTLHKSQSRLSQSHLGASLCTSKISVLTPHSWDDRCSSAQQNDLIFALFVDDRPPLCSIPWSSAMLTNFRASSTLCPQGFSIRDLSLLGAEAWTCAQDCNDSTNWTLPQQCDKRFLVDSWAPAVHACFDFWLLDSPHVSLYQYVFSLQGMAASVGNSNVFRAFFMVSINSSSSGSMK